MAVYRAGIDYSLTSPAVTVGTGKDFKTCKSFFYTTKKKHVGQFGPNVFGMMALPWESQMERIDNLSEWTMSILSKFNVTEVVLEGYSFGASGSRVFDLGENGGLLKWKMWTHNMWVQVPPPTTVKKFFHGKGNANKEQMHEAFLSKTSVDLGQLLDSKPSGNPVSDVVDSYAMYLYNFQ